MGKQKNKNPYLPVDVNVDGTTYKSDSPEYKQMYGSKSTSLLPVDEGGLPVYNTSSVDVVAEAPDWLKKKRENEVSNKYLSSPEGQRSMYRNLGANIAKPVFAVGNAAAEMTGVPGAVRFGQNPYENLKGTMNVLSDLSSPGGYMAMFGGGYSSDEEYQQAFNTLDAAGLAAGGVGMAKGAFGAGKNVVKQVVPKTTKVYPLTHDPIKVADFISEEGNRMINVLESKEGRKRLGNQFREANPELSDVDINHLVDTRINESRIAVDFNQAADYNKKNELFKQENTKNLFRNEKEKTENVFKLDDLYLDVVKAEARSFPEHNAHWSSENPFINKEIISEKPITKESLISLARPEKKENLFLDDRYNPGSISLGKGVQDNKKVLSHEIGHALQKGGRMPIDVELMKLLNSGYSADDLLKLPEDVQKAHKYFRVNRGNEPYAFLREQRQKMIEQGIMKTEYDNVTESMLLKSRKLSGKEDALEEGRRSFIEGERLLKIMPTTSYKKLAKIFNKAPVVAGAAATGAALGSQEAQGPSYRSGGKNPYIKTYAKGGEAETSTVEIERNERVYTPNGKMIMETPSNAPTHEQGGVKVTLPNGSLVFPKKYFNALDAVSGLPGFKKITDTMLDNAEKAYLRGEAYSSGGKRK